MPNKLFLFWQELKRRNVVRVITVYAGAAFVILELTDIITEPLKLPSWLLPVVIVLLSIGFIIAIILSWVYDIHPEGGVVKTVSAEEVEAEDIHLSSNNWKIASYISFVVIAGLIVLNIIPRAGREAILDKSIVVLPFKNDSPDQERMYFINGTMEAILDNLCKIKDLRVPGRTSVEQYRDNPKPITVVAQEMNVSYVLEGSGHRDGNNVRLFVQLLDGKKDKHIWSKSYDADIEDIFSMQSEIAQLVAAEIESVISPQEKQLIEKIPTSNQTAYDLYQKALEERYKYNPGTSNADGLDRAVDLFRYAIEYDSTFAMPYLALGEIYYDKFMQNHDVFSHLDCARIMADNALSYDPELAGAYNLKGYIYKYEGKTARALASYDRAIELNPNMGSAYSGKGWLFWEQKDFVNSIENFHQSTLRDRRSGNLLYQYQGLSQVLTLSGFDKLAIHFNEKALKLHADSARYFYELAGVKHYSGNYPESIELALEAYRIDPDLGSNLAILGDNYLFCGQFEESFKYFEKYVNILDTYGLDTEWYNVSIAFSYLKNGSREKAEYFIEKQIREGEECIKNRRSGYLTQWVSLVQAYALKGDAEKALETFKLFSQNDRMDILVTRFRDDPRFATIIDMPEFLQICAELETRYQKEHERVRQWLEENDIF